MAKLSEELSTHIDDDMAAAFKARCHEAGCKPSELLRDMICDLLYGVTYGEHVADVRRRALERPAASVPQTSGTLIKVAGR